MGRIFRYSLIHFVEGMCEGEEKWGKKKITFLCIGKRSVQRKGGGNKAACLRWVFLVHYSFWVADRPIYNSNQLPDKDPGTTWEGKTEPCRA